MCCFGQDWSPNCPKFSGKFFRKNTQTLCSKVVISTARGLRDFPAIFAEPLWDDSGSGPTRNFDQNAIKNELF